MNCSSMSLGSLRAFGAKVRTVIEGFVAATANVENDAHVDGIPYWRRRRTTRTHEQERDVRHEEHAEEGEKPFHGGIESFGGAGQAREARYSPEIAAGKRPSRHYRLAASNFQRPFSMSDA